jgi:cupin fold WbuC family metalloprotein
MSEAPRFLGENIDVFYVTDAVPMVGDEEIAFLKEQAGASRRKRCRLCLHPAPTAAHHEMLIVHHREAYVRPARHHGRNESLIVIEGEALAFIFDDEGTPLSIATLGPAGSGRACSYYMPAGTWHTIVVTSTWLVFVEAAPGPFDRELTSFPPWAPDGHDAAAAASYMRGLLAAASAE